MDTFQIIVLTIAALVLIIILTAIGLGLRNLKNKVVYPPIANQCPDYWTVATDNVSCSIPLAGGTNAGNIYINGSVSFTSTVPGYDSMTNTINFTDPGWIANNSSTCNKQTWANQYQVVWDGISNYNSC
jgi:hypothetical protein